MWKMNLLMAHVCINSITFFWFDFIYIFQSKSVFSFICSFLVHTFFWYSHFWNCVCVIAALRQHISHFLSKLFAFCDSFCHLNKCSLLLIFYDKILTIEFSVSETIVCDLWSAAASSYSISRYFSICMVHCLILYPFCAIVVAIYNTSDDSANGSRRKTFQGGKHFRQLIKIKNCTIKNYR